MSKSLKRVKAALTAAGLDIEIRETGNACTAQDAAEAVGCALDQIAKSMIFQGTESRKCYLFLTAGGNQVDLSKAAQAAGEALERAQADHVRTVTGFAIGGVAPVGHVSPIDVFLDPRLLDFEEIWAAAGTPRHVISISPAELQALTNSLVIDFKSLIQKM